MLAHRSARPRARTTQPQQLTAGYRGGKRRSEAGVCRLSSSAHRRMCLCHSGYEVPVERGAPRTAREWEQSLSNFICRGESRCRLEDLVTRMLVSLPRASGAPTPAPRLYLVLGIVFSPGKSVTGS